MIVGAPFPPELEQICKDRFGCERVGIHVYGLTEAVPVTHVPYTEYVKPGCAGRRNEDYEIRPGVRRVILRIKPTHVNERGI